jgi:hypothetical protein
MDSYNKILEYENINKFPFNLNLDLTKNIIFTKNEIELEYIKDYNIYKDQKNKKGSNEIKNNIHIYSYTSEI